MKKLENIKCTLCGSDDTQAFVTLYAVMPTAYDHNLTKKLMQTKEFSILSQNHLETQYFCKSCRRFYKGNDNEIRK